MSELVYKGPGWTPDVIQKDGAFYLDFAAGADANHDPRPFMVPITKAHLGAIESSYTRHLLLWVALLPLCDAAGTRGTLNENAAIALLDPILLGSEPEVESFFKTIPYYKNHLIARHADIPLLEEGKLFAALEHVTEQSDFNLAAEYTANKERAARGVELAPIDTAILKFTNRYLYRSGLSFRKPDAVDPELLDEVQAIISIAEQAVEGVEFTTDPNDFAARKQEWNLVQERIENAVHEHYPMLVSDSLQSVAVLLCSEASKRARDKAASEQ